MDLSTKTMKMDTPQIFSHSEYRNSTCIFNCGFHHSLPSVYMAQVQLSDFCTSFNCCLWHRIKNIHFMYSVNWYVHLPVYFDWIFPRETCNTMPHSVVLVRFNSLLNCVFKALYCQVLQAVCIWKIQLFQQLFHNYMFTISFKSIGFNGSVKIACCCCSCLPCRKV